MENNAYANVLGVKEVYYGICASRESNQIATIRNANFHNKSKRSKSLSVEGGPLRSKRTFTESKTTKMRVNICIEHILKFR